MIKRLITVVLILLIVCSGTAYAIEPDDEVMLFERTVTVDDVVAVSLQVVNYDKELDVLAKVVYGEARGVKSDMEKAAVVWCVLNRVDDNRWSDDIIRVATQSDQFAYESYFPVEEELRDLAQDVLVRWLLEKQGFVDVGRVLPSTYCYFASHGDGRNWFRILYDFPDNYLGLKYWYWSLEDPYE